MTRFIGEPGPEVFVPKSNGYIVPNNGVSEMNCFIGDLGLDFSPFSEQGRKNHRALIEAAKRIRDSRDKSIEQGASIAEANAVLEANYRQLVDQATADGVTGEAVEQLLGSLFRVPKPPADG